MCFILRVTVVDIYRVPPEPPNIHFVAQVPENRLGDQLVSQWIGCMSNQSWIFKYGRVKLSLLVRPNLYEVSDLIAFSRHCQV